MRAERTFAVDRLTIEVYSSREAIGMSAAQRVRQEIREMLKTRAVVNMIFAAAPSQNEFLASLIKMDDIDWSRINAFHMDEYIGIDPNASHSFGQFLRTRLFEVVPFKAVHYISTLNPEVECQRYEELLVQYPPDIVCLGIGENGHLAFNDPPVADFDDPQMVKIVELDHECRQQQVNDDCFDSLELVPKTALTLTIPALMSAKHMCCVVPGSTKASAVRNTLEGEISTACPASILRKHHSAVLYLDAGSYQNIGV
ncbi:MAG: glucosamine-6-phosphate deaminase [Cyclobacteriaceae bacterium]